MTLPALVLMLLASTVLGVTLLVKRFRPVLPAVLLALMIPLALRDHPRSPPWAARRSR